MVNGAGHSAASPHAQRLATLALEHLRDHPAVSVDELLTAVMRRFPGQRRERLASLLDESVAAGLLHRDRPGHVSAPGGPTAQAVTAPILGPSADDTVGAIADATASGAAVAASAADTTALPAPADPAEEPPVEPPAPSGALGAAGRAVRAVIVDLESVVHTTTSDPYTDKRIYQIGAVRLSNDSAWVAEQPQFSAYVELPDDSWVIRSKRVREAHASAAVSPRQALEDLYTYTAETDLIVTYNGTQADFPLLAATAAREDMPDLRGTGPRPTEVEAAPADRLRTSR